MFFFIKKQKQKTKTHLFKPNRGAVTMAELILRFSFL